MFSFKAGADPEVFLQDAAGAFVSAIDKIGGSKWQPRPLVELGDGFAVQEDNVAVEFNIPAADSRELFITNISRARDFLAQQVAKQGLKFSNSSATQFPVVELLDPRAQEFGCDPDFNAWKHGRRNRRPLAADASLRSAGGHVHVGHKFKGRSSAIKFIKYMDLFLGVPSVLMDKGELRKQLYGAAGAFRHKPYGVEYRTLSNFWIFKENLIGWVWDQTATALDAWQNDVALEETAIQEAINGNNKQLAAQLVDHYKVDVVYA